MALHHVALRTRRLARLERFYRAAFRLSVRRRTDRSVWLAAGRVVLMLELALASEPRVATGTMDLLCFAAKSRAELAKLRRRIGRMARIEGETAYTFYFRDPDGRRVGISRYRFSRRAILS